MARLSTIKHTSTHRVCVYGEPKSGKTQLAGELSREFDIIYFGLENGHETLLKLPQEQQERIECIIIPDTRVFPIAIETMLRVVTGNRVEICEEHGKVSCSLCKKDQKAFSVVELDTLPNSSIVVIDSLTQLAISAISYITKGQPNDYKYEWDDYRKQGTLMDRFLSQIQQAKYNVVCLTHVTETEQEDGRKRLVPVAGTTSFSRNTGKYFDHIIYCEVKNRRHNFASCTIYSNNILTGSRTDVSLEDSQSPSLLSIFRGNIPVEQKQEVAATRAAVPGKIAVTNLSKLIKTSQE